MAKLIVMRAARLTALICLGFLGLSAQERLPVSGPVLGFVSDDSGGIRPILGVPGAAILGRSTRPLVRPEGVAFSPGRDYALALLLPDHRAALLRGLRTGATVVDLEVPPGAGRVAISPSGDAAVLYYPERQSVAVIAGLPDSPSLSWSREAPYLSTLASLAVSDGGGAVLVAAAVDQSAVWLISSDGAAQVVSYVAAAPSLAFLAGSRDALIADGGANTVTLARQAEGPIQLTQIGGAAEGVSRPVAVAATAGNHSVLVANSEPAGVVTLSLAGGEPSVVPCNCQVIALEPLAGGTTFRVNEPGEGPLWLLDMASSPPRMVFVPDEAPVRTIPVRAPSPLRPGGDR
jgi:hypothetical protein